MKSPQPSDRNLPPITEYALILGAGASAAASIAAQQLAAASIPVTTLVALGMLNRYRLDQRIKDSEPVGPTLDETSPQPRSVNPNIVSSKPVPEARTIYPGQTATPTKPMTAVATLSAARFSRHRSLQDNLEVQQKAYLQKIGELLKQTRQEKGLSLEDIYQQTFIQVYNLKAIEEGNLRCLPEPFYIKAFIKKYAAALGLDRQQLGAEFPG
jgi:hypothetical protein